VGGSSDSIVLSDLEIVGARLILQPVQLFDMDISCGCTVLSINPLPCRCGVGGLRQFPPSRRTLAERTDLATRRGFAWRACGRSSSEGYNAHHRIAAARHGFGTIR